MSKHLTDRGSQQPPRLALGHSWWGLSALPEPAESYLPKLKASGFESIEIGLRPEHAELIKKCRFEHGLKIIGQGWAADFARAKPFIDRAAELSAWALNMHLGHAYMTADEAASLFTDCREFADGLGVALLAETHRGCMTQDVYRTREWVALEIKASFNLDLSHLLLANEGYGGSTELFFKQMYPVLERTSMIHGRISDCQSIQVDVGREGKSPSVQVFMDVWTVAMDLWRKTAKNGHVFLFEPELGPPPYAQVDLSGKQISDRWMQSLVLAELGKRAWNTVVK